MGSPSFSDVPLCLHDSALCCRSSSFWTHLRSTKTSLWYQPFVWNLFASRSCSFMSKKGSHLPKPERTTHQNWHRILNPNAPWLSGMYVLLGLLWHRWFQWQLIASPAKHGCRDLGWSATNHGDHGAKMCKKGILPRLGILNNIYIVFSYEVRQVRYWYFLWWIFQPVLELLEDTGITLRPGLFLLHQL